MDLSDKVILLIDDIYTTGLTIHHAGCKLSALNVRKFKCLRLHDRLNVIKYS